jgi:lysophospholipase L1-like esterase
MAAVLAFGDSLTWGSRDDGQGRHARADRWPEALAAGLSGVHVVADGLRGRTTCRDRPGPADLNGARALPGILHAHAPLDLVIVMLGTNDIYEGTETPMIRDGLERLVEIIRQHPYRLPAPAVPRVMLVSPPPMMPCADADVTPSRVAQSEALGRTVAALARRLGCAFFDAATVGRAGRDGYHLDARTSRKLGEALRTPVRAVLEG